MRRRSFSLVELVLVITINSIIAAIAVPRISRGAQGANEAALRGSLYALRMAIDLYSVEHEGAYPAADKSEETLFAQMTKKTNAAGEVGSASGEHIFGPYLRGQFPPVPVGPNAGARGVRITHKSPITDEVKESQKDTGWVYNFETGEIIPNTDDTDAAEYYFYHY